MSLLFPLGIAALGALVPLVLLYLLRQKRIEERVSANFLWSRAVEDLRASSLFQRFRAPLLFILQAAAVVLCALAAAGASLDLDVGSVPRRKVVLLDRSASMRTTDEDGRSRFDVAKELATEIVDGLSRSDEASIVAFDVRPEVLSAFTSDAERLRAVVAAAAPRDLPTKIGDALETAVSFCRASRGFDVEIVLLTDGGVEDGLPPVPFPVRYVKVGRSGANQGIAGISLTRTPGEPTQALVRVANGDTIEASRTVVLRRGDDVLDARQATAAPRDETGVLFALPEPAAGATDILQVSLEGRDANPGDDSVRVVLRPAVPRTGLVVRAAPSLHLDPERLSRLRPGLAVIGVSMDEARAAIAAGSPRVDLVVWDGVAPSEPVDVPAQIFVDCVPPGSGLTVAATMRDPLVIDWSRTHATTARCQFDDVFVLEAKKLAGAERSLALVESTGGPLVLLTPVPGREVVVVAFDPAKSNLPLKLAWPLFLANSVDALLAASDRGADDSIRRTGDALPLDTGRGPWTADTPGAKGVPCEPDPMGRPLHRRTWEAGVHDLRDRTGAVVPWSFATLDAREVDVAPRDTIVLGESVAATDPTSLRRNLLLRDPLLLAVLGLLLVEWAVWCGRR